METLRGMVSFKILLNTVETEALQICLQFTKVVNHFKSREGVSSGSNGYSDGLWNRNKRVWTPVALLHSLSNKYSWERYEPIYPPIYGLNSTTIAMGITLLLLLLLGFWFKLVMLVLRWLCWYYVGCVGISLVVLVFRWLLSPR